MGCALPLPSPDKVENSGATLSDERVGATLGSHLRWWTMAGKHRHVVTERKYFFPDPAYQKINISTRQITSADAARKKNVAADKQSIFTRKETKTTRTMPWNFQHLELGAEKISG